MANNDKRPGDPAANMRITLKYPDVTAFVEKFATNVSRGGIFIASRAPKPIGTQVRFELLLADGKSRVLKGEGAVAWVREFDPRNPNRPHGMGIKFARLDSESRKVIDRILAFKKERGVKEDSAVIPLPPVATREDSVVTPPPRRPPSEPGPAAMQSSPPAVESLPPVGEAAAPRPEGERVRQAPAPVAEGSAPRLLPALEVSVADIEALLAADGPALEATLARALSIARATAAGGGPGAAGGGTEMDELEALIRQPLPAAPTSVADAVAGLASLLGRPAVGQKPAPEGGDTRPAQAELDAVPDSTHEIVLEAEPPESDLDDTGPISIARIVAAASTEPAPAPPARSPFAAEDLGAGELDPLDLEGLELDSARPGEIEPLPPPPHSAPHFRLDPGLEDTGAGREPARAAPPPAPAPVDEEIEISGDFSLEEDNDGRTIVSPMPSAFLDAEPPAQPTAETTPKPEKKGFFSKLFKK